MMLEAARVDLCQCHCHPRAEAARLTSTRCDFLTSFLTRYTAVSHGSPRAPPGGRSAGETKGEIKGKGQAEPEEAAIGSRELRRKRQARQEERRTRLGALEPV
jgi:hypothetical protein